MVVLVVIIVVVVVVEVMVLVVVIEVVVVVEVVVAAAVYPLVPLATQAIPFVKHLNLSVARQNLNLAPRFAAFSCFPQNGPFAGLFPSSSPCGSLRIPIQCLFYIVSPILRLLSFNL